MLHTYTHKTVSKVSDALKLNEDEFNSEYHRKKPEKSDEIIFSCLVGGRAQKAAEVASGLGYEKYKH